MEPSISTDKLSIGYSTPENAILSNVNINLKGGEFVCLLGANGAGKSTLIRTVGGLLKKLTGKVKVNNLDFDTLSINEVAHPISSGNLTVYELVALGRYPHTNWIMSLTENDKRHINEAIDITGIAPLLDRNVNELSDGQLQKCQIARALAQNCPIMILDEPTTHLDLNNRVEVMRLLRNLAHDKNKLVMVATHELDLALQMADSFLVISGDGIERGVPEDLVLTGVLDRVFEMKGYDLKSGRTIFTPVQKLSTRVLGQGYPALWTRNALERNGFAVDKGSGDVKITVKHEKDAQIKWEIEYGEKKEVCYSIQDLVESLKNI